MIAPDHQINEDNADVFLEQLEEGFRESSARKEISSHGTVSDLFGQAVLARIETLFESSRFGHYTLPCKEFCAIIAEYIPANLVENIYRSIDVNDVGYVRYADFTNYLIASEAGSSFSAKNFISRLVPSFSQEEDLFQNHKDTIDCLVFVKRPFPMLISGGRDGQLSLWDSDNLQLLRNIEHRNKNSVYTEELSKTMDTMTKARTRRLLTVPPTDKPSKVAITALCPLFNWGLVCVGSADCSLTVYELSNQCDVCGRLTSMETLPTAIECFQRPSRDFADEGLVSAQGMGSMVTFIAIGDSTGQLHLIKLHKEFGSAMEVGMKKKNQLLFAESIRDGYSKLRIQKGWITKLLYIPEVNALVASSVDSTVCFIDVDRWHVIKTFTGHTATTLGIRTFSWSSFGKYIVSGSDRVLLFWDAFTLEVSSRIDTLRSPIVTVEVYDSHNKIFAALLNKTIMVWHNITFEVLQVVMDATLYKPVNNLGALVFLPERNVLYTAGNKITVWTLERSTEGPESMEEEDVCVALYNSRFNLVIVVRTLGTVKVYQAETGEIKRQFLVRPVDSRTGQVGPLVKDPKTDVYIPMVSHAVLDKNQTRLIVVGWDSSVQYWNIHDGSNLIQVMPQLFPTSLANEFGAFPKCISLVHQDIVLPSFAPSLPAAAGAGGGTNGGGQGRAASANASQPTSSSTTSSSSAHPSGGGANAAEAMQPAKPMKLLMLATELGHVCIYQESKANIEPIPSAFLRLLDSEDQQIITSSPTDLKQPKSSLATVVRKLLLQGKHAQHEVPHPPSGPGGQTAAESRLRAGGGRKSVFVPKKKDPEATSNDGSATEGDSTSAQETSSPTRAQAGHPLSSSLPSIVWMKVLPQSSALAVSYGTGRIVLWDLTTDHKLGDLKTVALGAVLNGMKMKTKPKIGQSTDAAAMLAHSAMAGSPAKEKPSPLPGAGGDSVQQEAAHTDPNRQITKDDRHKSLVNDLNAISQLDNVVEGIESHASMDPVHRRLSMLGRKTAVSASKPVSNRATRLTSGHGIPAVVGETQPASSPATPSTEAGVKMGSSLLELDKDGQFPVLLEEPEHSESDGERDTDEASASEKPSRASSAVAENEAVESVLIPSQPPPPTTGRRDSAAFTMHKHRSLLQTYVAPSSFEGNHNHPPTEGLSSRLTHLDGRGNALESNEEEHMVRKPTIVGEAGGASRLSQVHGLRNRTFRIPDRGRISGDTSILPTLIPTLPDSPRGSLLSTSSAFNSPRGSLWRGSSSYWEEASILGGDSLLPALEHKLEAVSMSYRPFQGDSPREVAEASREVPQGGSSSHPPAATRMTTTGNAAKPETHGTAASGPAGQTPSSLPTDSSGSRSSSDKIVVDCVVFLPTTNIMIGACSDRNLRFWDLETKEVLCSCLYLPSSIVEAAAVVNAMSGLAKKEMIDLKTLLPDEIIRHIQTSDTEDILLAAYDSGMVRVWSIQLYSIQTLKNLLQKHLYQLAMEQAQAQKHGLAHHGKALASQPEKKEFGAGMSLAVSPLTLLAEWQAHNCPILSVDYVWFDYESNKAENADADNASEGIGPAFSPSSPPPLSSRPAILSPGRQKAPAMFSSGTYSSPHPAGGPSSPMGPNAVVAATTKPPLAAPLTSATPGTGRDRRQRQFDMGTAVQEGYVLTAGLDQRVCLWTMQGKCVGEFGTYGWDINNEETWGGKRPSASKASRKMGGKYSSRAHGSSMMSSRMFIDGKLSSSSQVTAQSITKESINMVTSPSTAFLQNFIRQKKSATATEMNRYIEELSRKLINRPPSYAEVDNRFKEVVRKHPIEVVKPLKKRNNRSPSP